MAMKNRLGFGMMRLPVHNGDPTGFDYEQINRMVDEFIGAGFTYFDTSYVYHNGKSEEATRKALVERYPRDSFTVATKFPTFDLKHEDEIEPIFARQLKNLGVDYIDYYLLHNVQTIYYDGINGSGGIMQACNLFDHAVKWKKTRKVKHLGFSFHSSAKLPDRILTEHPEMEFVQIALNYYDWESGFVQARKCYEVIRRHGRQEGIWNQKFFTEKDTRLCIVDLNDVAEAVAHIVQDPKRHIGATYELCGPENLRMNDIQRILH